MNGYGCSPKYVKYGEGTGSRQQSTNKSQQQQFKRAPLPIDRVRKKIEQIVHPLEKTAIIIGETACGKSTQIPQVCLHSPWAKDGLIAVTQPRRVAARTLAMRVAQEQGSAVGETVGYRFRFDNCADDKKTRLIYMTEGILLRELLHDCRLKRYSAIIVDEVHERSVNTDVLLYILRQAQKERIEREEQPLRIILMSATLNAKQLSNYFGGAPIYYVRGRAFPVKVLYASELRLADNDYLFNAVTLVLDLHETEPISSGFLVFLTGQEEIDTTMNVIRKIKQNANQQQGDERSAEHIFTVPLCAAVPTAIQQRAFDPPPEGKRKVVFATNIAETSVTIPGIDVVIDSGKVKRRSFTARTRMDVLEVENISKAQATQRAGRAGREGPGKCYRLYREADYESLPDQHMPELQRCNLTYILLELIELGVQKVSSLSYFLSPPDTQQIRSSVEDLLALQAILEEEDGQLKITPEGTKLLAFPVEPAHAKILLAASELGCLDEACTVVSFLSADPVFQFNTQDLLCLTDKHQFGQEEQGGMGMGSMKYYSAEGDHVRLVSIYRAYASIKRTQEKLKEFCNSNNLNQKRLEQVWLIRKQLHGECTKQNLHFATSQNNNEALRKAIFRGLFLNVAHWDNTQQCYVLERDRQVRVRIHPSSCLHNAKPSAFVFTELLRTNEVYARDICPVQLDWILENSQAQRNKIKIISDREEKTKNKAEEKEKEVEEKTKLKKKKAEEMEEEKEENMTKRKKKVKGRRKKKQKRAAAVQLVTYSSSSSSSSKSNSENGDVNDNGEES